MTDFDLFHRLNIWKKCVSVEHQELVEKAQQGDFEAFGVLVHTYSKYVYSISIKMVRDFHQAEDLSQEVFVKAWQYLKELRDPNKLSSWLATLTRHHCLDYLRKRDRL
jgi:DNA-directed RNA polymerase specialized sigma24 family protein